MSEYYLTNDELYHHGIKGQKWGQRRFQNEDGSLTTAGRERYGYGVKRQKYEAQKAIYKTAKRNALNANLDAYAYSNRHPISKITNKNVARKLNQKQVDAAKSTLAAEEAKQLMKSAKAEYKNSDEYKVRSEKIKKAAKIGAAVAATALVAYGAYKIGSNMSQQKKWNAAKEYGKKYYSELAAKNLHKMDVYSNELKTVNESVRKIYGNSSNMPTNSGTYARWENAEKKYMNAYKATSGASSKAGYYGSGMYGALSSHMKKHN